MAPVPGPPARPRVVVYYQTMHVEGGRAQSLLPLLSVGTALSHVIVAAFHIQQSAPKAIRLNDDLPDAPLFDTLWFEAGLLQRQGIKLLAMLGGAAPGCYDNWTLDAPDEESFVEYYEPVRDLLRRYAFDGIDLDVEQDMSLAGIVRLIRRLRSDFGPDFFITLAPVAAAMVGLGNLSGFDYFDLESQCGAEISWYNTQLYNNWGGLPVLSSIYMLGWRPDKIVVGLLTNPDLGQGFIDLASLRSCVEGLRKSGIEVGGVFGWEYFNSLPGGVDAPWLWAREVSSILQVSVSRPWLEAIIREGATTGPRSKKLAAIGNVKLADGDEKEEAALPDDFEYESEAGEK